MLLLKTDTTDPNRNIVVRLTRRLFPVSERFHGPHFFVRAGSRSSHEALGGPPRGLARERASGGRELEPGASTLTACAQAAWTQ